MRFRGDIRKMRYAPTYELGSTVPLFKVVIEYDDSTSSITNWWCFETTAENVTYDEGLEIERKRLEELGTQFKQDQ